MPHLIKIQDTILVSASGPSDAIFVDGKGIRMGPPQTYENIRKAIAKRAKKLG